MGKRSTICEKNGISRFSFTSLPFCGLSQLDVHSQSQRVFVCTRKASGRLLEDRGLGQLSKGLLGGSQLPLTLSEASRRLPEAFGSCRRRHIALLRTTEDAMGLRMHNQLRKPTKGKRRERKMQFLVFPAKSGMTAHVSNPL